MAERVIAEDGKKAWATALRYSAVGLELVLGVVLGFGIGSWLDKRYESQPTFTLLLMLLGTAAGFTGLVRVVREYRREIEREEDEESRD